MANLVVSAVSTWDNSGLKKGQKDISVFDKGLKSVGKTLGAVFAVSTIVNFSKHAIDAFSKDQAAAKALETQLNNTGYAFAAPGVELYIANLQKMTGVLDDHLRPALQTILTASGSLTESQKALATAIDVSAGTGKSLEEVSAAIAKGFSGQTKGITGLNAGIDKNIIASGDMNKILKALNEKWSGQNKARLETYAGKMDLLQISAANASEIIGKGLLDSLSMLGKDQNIATLGSSLEKLATTIANVVVGLGTILGKVVSIGEAIFTKLHLDKIIGFLYNNSLIGKLASFGKQQMAAANPVSFQSISSYSDPKLIKKKELEIQRKLNAAKAQELALLNKKSAVDQLKDKFDLERISLTAALNAATDSETKLRLQAQLAILDNNEALAKKYLAEMNGVKAVDELTKSVIVLAGAAMDSAAKFKQINPFAGTQYGETGRDPSSTVSSAISTGVLSALTSFDRTPNIPVSIVNPLAGTYYGATGRDLPSNLTVNIDASNMVDTANMTRVVQQAFLEINKNGYSTVPAGQGF
jgi:hypothetical protein